VSSSEPPTPETLERKCDSLRPGGNPEPLDPGEVTGVIDLALERLQVAQEATTSALEAATKRLQDETRLAIAFARRLSMPPPKG
jgi:hypothetical protein